MQPFYPGQAVLKAVYTKARCAALLQMTLSPDEPILTVDSETVAQLAFSGKLPMSASLIAFAYVVVRA